jgi:hypothetical protein
MMAQRPKRLLIEASQVRTLTSEASMKLNWKKVGREGKYRFWESEKTFRVDGNRSGGPTKPIYQVTTDDAPPTTDGGYFDFGYLLKVKNCSIERLDRPYGRLS